MNYPTISEAIKAGVKYANNRRLPVNVISAETIEGIFKGQFALCDPINCDREDTYIFIDRNGDIAEGPKALELPVGAA